MIKTHSRFLYGISICGGKNILFVDEGFGEVEVSIPASPGYTFGELAEVVSGELNRSLTGSYSVEVDRVKKGLRIRSSSTFSILSSSASDSSRSVLGDLGFLTEGDLTGASEYASIFPIGREYRTQFMLQGFSNANQEVRLSKASVNESASGIEELVHFGEQRFVEMSFNYITDIYQACSSPIRNNPCGVSDFNEFINWMIFKGNVEFMPNEDDANCYHVLRLESTPGNKSGTGFKLKELYARGLPDFYESGKLRFRWLGGNR